MATQTIEFGAPDGLTLVTRLFSAGSDTVVQSASSTTEQTNRDGIYRAVFTDAAAATYLLLATVGGVCVARWWVTLTLTTATFQAYELPTSIFGSGGVASDVNVTSINGLPVATGQVNINVVNQTTFQNGTLTIIRGADYLSENTNLVHFTGVANIGAATILYLTIVNNSTSAIITGISRLASTAIDAGLQTADFAIPSAIIAGLADGTNYSFSVERKITVSATDYYNPILLGPCEVRANNRTFV